MTNAEAPVGPGPKAPPTFLPVILFLNSLLVQAAMLGVLLMLFASKAPGIDAGLSAFFPRGFADPVVVGGYLVAFAAAVAAFKIPTLMTAQKSALTLPGAGQKHPLGRVISAYIISLCVLEVCSLAGFVVGFLQQAWVPAVPLILLGVGATLVRAPTAKRFQV